MSATMPARTNGDRYSPLWHPDSAGFDSPCKPAFTSTSPSSVTSTTATAPTDQNIVYRVRPVRDSQMIGISLSKSMSNRIVVCFPYKIRP
ncbi:hypothetical protein D9B85_05685 [Corynebacterium diphtheriae]|nr:hypothetical protein BVL41_04030 [Corynebacterium diphtheriae]RKW87822.1 hypothetical protein D9B36_12115 [Corynebacterium diphtheriae]RKX01512.1 hypothetical protein D9B85_05685 [Corynebacterium diphtheriae]RLP08653.1 hypothetical protein D9R17_06265 [Corynebacterium diphtheriae]UJL53428.1 hypothetical protein FE380_04070 [Corynebacterium diphtheriae]